MLTKHYENKAIAASPSHKDVQRSCDRGGNGSKPHQQRRLAHSVGAVVRAILCRYGQRRTPTDPNG